MADFEEQTGVIDRYRATVGERAQQIDLLRAIAADGFSSEYDPAYELVAADRRDRENRTIALRQQSGVERQRLFHCDVGDVLRFARRGRAADNAVVKRRRVCLEGGDEFRSKQVSGAHAEYLAVLIELIDQSAIGPGQFGCMDHDGLQNVLQIKRRVDGLNRVAERADFVERPLQRLGPLGHFMLKSGMRLLKPRRHPVKIFGQLLKFIARIQVQTGVEIAGFEPPGAAPPSSSIGLTTRRPSRTAAPTARRHTASTIPPVRPSEMSAGA